MQMMRRQLSRLSAFRLESGRVFLDFAEEAKETAAIRFALHQETISFAMIVNK